MPEKEYIEREALQNKAFGENHPTFYDGQDIADWYEKCINETAAADVSPVRHGFWVAEYDCGYTTPHCSECGEIALTKEETSYDYVYSSYCPHCGAKMDGGEGE